MFEIYFEFLEDRGQSFNLTAISGAEDVARLHFLDSIALLKLAQFQNKCVIDIGSGAGFPGIPLKISEPSINLTLLEATEKKAVFLSTLCALLGVDAVCVHTRAEDAARKKEMRERFDLAVSRAVARLNVLCELCLPFVRVGGTLIAMKNVDSAAEIADAKSAIKILGAELKECVDYTIPGTEIMHRAVIIQKTSLTREEYPRRFAKIKKSPL